MADGPPNPAARVCPHCGDAPGTGVFCEACGRNLVDVEQLPTREAWEREHAPSGAPPVSAADALAAFLAAMHAAGDPGAERTQRVAPGFLGRTQYDHGWVVRPVEREEDAPPGRYEPGRFVSVTGQLHRLDGSTIGYGQRMGPRYVDLVGPEVDAGDDARLAGELAAVLRANGL